MEALCQLYALVEKQEEWIRRLEEQGNYHSQNLNSLEDQLGNFLEIKWLG